LEISLPEARVTGGGLFAGSPAKPSVCVSRWSPGYVIGRQCTAPYSGQTPRVLEAVRFVADLVRFVAKCRTKLDPNKSTAGPNGRQVPRGRLPGTFLRRDAHRRAGSFDTAAGGIAKASAARPAVHVIPESPGPDSTATFHPFPSRLHHAAGGVHPIFILSDGRAPIVCRIRAPFVCSVCRDKTTWNSRTCGHAAAHNSLLGRQ
jgi:hypothetical protein